MEICLFIYYYLYVFIFIVMFYFFISILILSTHMLIFCVLRFSHSDFDLKILAIFYFKSVHPSSCKQKDNCQDSM